MKTSTIKNIGPFAGGILALLPVFAFAAEIPATWSERGMARPLVVTDSAKKFDREAPRPVGTERLLIETSAPIYTPPRRGTTASTIRVGGGTRGNADLLPTITVLAPNGDGITSHDRPTLYWYTSRPLTAPVLFTFIETEAVAPAAIVRLALPSERGIHAIRFTELGITLAPGTTYHWSIAVVTDAARRSHDLVATGTIEYIKGPEVAITVDGDYHAYAREGLWYDAIEALFDRLHKNPSDDTLRLHRAALLDAVGLGLVAGDDRH
jgi:hypothetical protein